MKTKLLAARVPEELQDRIAVLNAEQVKVANANPLLHATVSTGDTLAQVIDAGLATLEPKFGIKPSKFEPKPKSKGGRPSKQTAA